MWLTWGLTEKPLTMALGLVSSAWTGFLGSWSVWVLTFLDLEGGGEGRKDGYGSREVYISTKGAILGFA